MLKISRRKFIQTGVLASIGILLVDLLWFERKIIKWKLYDISRNKEESIKIIHISDLHLKEIGEIHRTIAKRINRKNPDIIFITGDSIDSNDELETYSSFLKLINYSIKKYSVLGNWEHWGNVSFKALNEICLRNNGHLLVNEYISFSKDSRQIGIIGVDDYIGGNADWKLALDNSSVQQELILLSHCPAYRDIVISENKKYNIKLMLSGHTHGGQINLFGMVPFKPQGSGRYLKGWYKKQQPWMFVSKGIGTSVLPVRFGSRAEVVEILV